MTEDTPKHKCEWIARDSEGRPKCEHGWAKRTGDRWRCPEKRRLAVARYNQTEKRRISIGKYNQSELGREAKRRHNASVHRTSTVALRNLMDIRSR